MAPHTGKHFNAADHSDNILIAPPIKEWGLQDVQPCTFCTQPTGEQAQINLQSVRECISENTWKVWFSHGSNFHFIKEQKW